MNDKTTETTALSSDATEVRRQKLALLREQIGDVYPAHFHRTLTNAEPGGKICRYRSRRRNRRHGDGGGPRLFLAQFRHVHGYP